ncbi:MAG: TetR/AcrR family transcriptional regulator [Cyanobacteria bacterium P01_A01_bin.45]
MSKGKQTKERILQQAAELFNQYGYHGSSISDIMRVTELKKGGIYNHFKSKDEIALLAFDYAVNCVQKHYLGVLRNKRHAVERLQAIIKAFSTYMDNPVIKGGCPLLNTAVESDDTHPQLRERTQKAMDNWCSLIVRIIDKGIARGEIKADVDPDEAATIMISILEGSLMMGKLYGDMIYIKRGINHLHRYIEKDLAS